MMGYLMLSRLWVWRSRLGPGLALALAVGFWVWPWGACECACDRLSALLALFGSERQAREAKKKGSSECGAI